MSTSQLGDRYRLHYKLPGAIDFAFCELRCLEAGIRTPIRRSSVVYPLKFLFTFLVNKWMGFAATVQIHDRQVPLLMEVFSGGFLAVSCIFMLLYGHALHKRDALELNALEVFDTKVSIGAAAINGFTAIASLAIAWRVPIQWSGFSGIILSNPPRSELYDLLLGSG